MASKQTPPAPLAEAARQLVASNTCGVLATLQTDDGYPYSSLVEYLPLPDGNIAMLLSTLAEHQKYLTADPRASLLIAPSFAQVDMLAQERVTLVGKVTLVEDKTPWRTTYLQHNPQAENYIDFSDFQFYQLYIQQVRYIAGFGRMGWIESEAYFFSNVNNGLNS